MSQLESASIKLAQAFGYLYIPEVLLLQELASAVAQDGVIVNIGAGSGTSGLAMREGNKSATIFTVDISPTGPTGGLENERNAFENAGVTALLPTQILGDSAEVGREWDRGPVDLVFIDGGHSYEQAKADTEAWQAHVKPGGVVAFHDYSADTWPDVTRWVDSWIDGRTVVGRIATTIAVRM